MAAKLFATMRLEGAALFGRVSAGLAVSCALLGALLASPVAAQTAATAQGRVGIHDPLTVLAIQDMDYGQIVTDGTAGEVTLDPTDQSCAVTNGTLVRSGPCRAAIFSGYAQRWSFINVDGTDPIVLTGPGGATMTIDPVIFADDTVMLQFGDAFLVLDDNGLFELRVGGVLNVGSNQPIGLYSGTITLNLGYN